MTTADIVINGKDASYLGFASSFAKRFDKSPTVRDFVTYFGVKTTTVKKRLANLEEQHLVKLWSDGHVDLSENIRLEDQLTEQKPLPQHEALLTKLLNKVHELLEDHERGENQIKHVWHAFEIGIAGDEESSFRFQARLLEEGFMREAFSHSRGDELACHLDPDELFECQFDLDHAIRTAGSGRKELAATTSKELADLWEQVIQPILDASLRFRRLYEDLLRGIEDRIEGCADRVEWVGPKSPTEWAKQFGISQRTFKRWVEDSKIQVKEITTRSYFISAVDVARRIP